jgi:hypothetical protein
MKFSWRWMPDSADSIGYGTSTSSPRFVLIGGLFRFAAAPNCQIPLRLCHCERTSCGRGYSGSGFVRETWPVHGVDRRGVFGTKAAAGAAVTTSAPVVVIRAAATAARIRRPSRVLRTRGCAVTCLSFEECAVFRRAWNTY